MARLTYLILLLHSLSVTGWTLGGPAASVKLTSVKLASGKLASAIHTKLASTTVNDDERLDDLNVHDFVFGSENEVDAENAMKDATDRTELGPPTTPGEAILSNEQALQTEQWLVANVQQYLRNEEDSTVLIPPELFQDLATYWHEQLFLPHNEMNTQLLPVVLARTTAILQLLDHLYHATRNELYRPTIPLLETCFQTLAVSRNSDHERLLDSLSKHLYGHPVTPVLGHCILKSIAKSRRRGSAKRAESFLRSMESPTVDCVNVVLTAWAKSGLAYAPERCERLFVLMEENDVAPNISSLINLMDAHAQLQTWEHAQQAEDILNGILENYQNDPAAALEPTIVAFTIPMNAWAKVKKSKSADRADRILRRLERLHADGVLRFGPDPIAYATSVKALLAGRKLKRAREILYELYERYLDGQDEYAPNLRLIQYLVDAYIKQDNLDEAEETVYYYDDVWANPPEDQQEAVAAIFQSVATGWAKVDDVQRALVWLNDIRERALNLETATFDRILEACGRAKNAEKCLQVFGLLETCRQEGTVQPNERSYTTFLRTLTQCNVPNAGHKAFGILERMEHMALDNDGMVPSMFTYNSVLYCLMEDENATPEAALPIVTHCLAKLVQMDRMDAVSIRNLVHCTKFVSDQQREKYLQTILQLGSTRGLLNEGTLVELKEVCPESIWESWFGAPDETDMEVVLASLPSDWKTSPASR